MRFSNDAWPVFSFSASIVHHCHKFGSDAWVVNIDTGDDVDDVSSLPEGAEEEKHFDTKYAPEHPSSTNKQTKNKRRENK